jgi:hypothetical protein
MNLLKRIPIDGEGYQKDIIKGLRYSNKTVIKWLRLLVAAGVLDEGMKETLAKRGRVWVKWYRLTPLGKWIRLFLITPKELSVEKMEELVKDLFSLYIKSLATLCKEYGIDPSVLRKTFQEALGSESITQPENTQVAKD